jgi:hypothetical protein
MIFGMLSKSMKAITRPPMMCPIQSRGFETVDALVVGSIVVDMINVLFLCCDFFKLQLVNREDAKNAAKEMPL